MSDATFSGFSPKAVTFLTDLKNNNNREWFNDHKSVYESEIKRPAALFMDAMMSGLETLTGCAHGSKLFRIHRDVRFSKDKTPYNAHLHISFTPDLKLPSPPMWFFGLGTERLSLGCGVFAFDKAALQSFRDRIVGTEGGKIAQALTGIRKKGVRIGEPDLKRVPAGYPKDHPHEELLRYKGLSAWLDHEDRKLVTRPDVVAFCLTEFKKLKPVYDLLAA